MKTFTVMVTRVCTILFASSISTFAQGNLVPTTAPNVPIMKTLQQIEPRIDLQNAPAAAVDTTNANYEFIIIKPGSYYLSANLGVIKANGIQIGVAGVTLDLNGFEVSRTSGSGGNGIEITALSHRANIRQGTVRNFTTGVFAVGSAALATSLRDLAVTGCNGVAIHAGSGAVIESCTAHDNPGNGIEAATSSTITNCNAFANQGPSGLSVANGSTLTKCTVNNHTGTNGISAGSGVTLADCTVSNNTTTYGIFVGSGCTLINCAATYNNGTYGISASTGSTLTNCSALSNTGTYGFSVAAGCTFTNCSAYGNTSAATASAGFETLSGCALINCSARNNTSTAATANATTGMGIDVGGDSTIQGCTASFNKGDGIRVSGGCIVRQNSCDTNGNNGDGADIHVLGARSRIEANNIVGGDRGIEVSGIHNLITGNSAGSTTIDYVIAADNRYGPILDLRAVGTAAVSGNVAADTTTTTHPWANFSY